jgi:hypothetical protein
MPQPYLPRARTHTHTETRAPTSTQQVRHALTLVPFRAERYVKSSKRVKDNIAPLPPVRPLPRVRHPAHNEVAKRAARFNAGRAGGRERGGAREREERERPIVGIRPHEVADRALVRNLNKTIKLLHVLNAVQRRRQPAVRREDGVVNDRRQRQVVKQICEVLPHLKQKGTARARGVKKEPLQALLFVVRFYKKKMLLLLL